MRCCITILLLILSISGLHAQKQGQERIDSLLIALEKTQVDTTRVHILHDLFTHNFRLGNNDVALQQSEQALALAQKIQFKKGIAHSYHFIGTVHNVQGDYPEALKNYREALKAMDEIGDKKGLATIYNSVGTIYRNQGNYPDALSNYHAALAILVETGDKNGMAGSYTGIGNTNYIQGNFPEALKNYQAALRMMEEVGNKDGIAATYTGIGNIQYLQGNATEALRNYQASLKLRQETGNKRGLANSYNNIANIYYSQDNYAEALENYLASLGIREEIGDKQGIAQAYDNIGIIYRNQGNYLESYTYLNEALEKSREINDKRRAAAVSRNIGELYLDILSGTSGTDQTIQAITHIANIQPADRHGLLHAAIEHFEQAVKGFKEQEAKESYQQTQKSLSEAYTLAGNYEKALVAYKEHSVYKDSVYNEENTRELTRLEVQYEADKKQDSLRFAAKQEQLALQKEMQLTALRHEYEQKQAQARSEEERRQLLLDEETKRQQIENQHAIAQAESKRREAEMMAKQQKKNTETEKEIAVRDATLEANRKQRWLFIGGLLALAVIGGLLYYQSRQRKKNNELLQNLNTELQEANRIKTRFFSILNHDLRSPVSNLIHFLHLKKENPELLDEETSKKYEQKTIQGAENLLITMEDLLLWSKGQMENFAPKSEKITVYQLFEDTKKVFSGYQSIQFVYHDPENLDIFTDANYLKTIIRNLTSNAINAFTTTASPIIVWQAFCEEGKTVLSITDNGPGADNEKFRALYDDKEVIGIKSGLGLHLIRDLAKAIDCEIEVESKKGEGTNIVLKFV